MVKESTRKIWQLCYPFLMPKPVFLVLDGPDGSGTTTQSALLAQRLDKEGHRTVLTAEPTHGKIGTWIREQLRSGSDLDPAALQLLFCADRAQHVKEVIEPALARGEIVVCDRYSPSTLVYAEAQGLPSSWLKDLNDHFTQPSCLILTLPPLKTSLERLGGRENQELFETEELQTKIHAGYQKLAKELKNTHIVDTSASIEESAQHIWTIVQKHLV
jgi:dTMP kinase